MLMKLCVKEEYRLPCAVAPSFTGQGLCLPHQQMDVACDCCEAVSQARMQKLHTATGDYTCTETFIDSVNDASHQASHDSLMVSRRR